MTIKSLYSRSRQDFDPRKKSSCQRQFIKPSRVVYCRLAFFDNVLDEAIQLSLSQGRAQGSSESDFSLVCLTCEHALCSSCCQGSGGQNNTLKQCGAPLDKDESPTKCRVKDIPHTQLYLQAACLSKFAIAKFSQRAITQAKAAVMMTK